MSKDAHRCKVSSACSKHKERKPKKPHYIPRPWGKPYNYKCFQCPFTCMEKSHLYNHMKYSLCKNSLSLLIESDWPYKKGNLLHPDQLRLQGELGSHCPTKHDPERSAIAGQSPPTSRTPDEEKKEPSVRDVLERKGRLGECLEEVESGTRDEAKRTKQEADVVMADAFSLDKQMLRAHSIEANSQLRQYRIPKACLSSPALLSDPWRLLAYPTQIKTKSEGQAGELPCYPPPPLEPPALNLSLLGLSYPLTPGLFSYLNPASSNAQVAPLPYLAHTHAHLPTDHTVLPPRLYYPFLCEHALSASPKMFKSPQSGSQDPASTTTKPSVWGLHKAQSSSSQASPSAWVFSDSASPQPAHGSGDSLKAAWVHEQTVKNSPAPPEPLDDSPEKNAVLGGMSVDLLENLHRTMPSMATADSLFLHSSADEWYADRRRATSESPSAEVTSSPLSSQRREWEDQEKQRDLLKDLFSALQEYRQAEHRAAAILARDSAPAQLLWDHLTQIRSQLSHITQALQQSTPLAEGPLDLSVKKDMGTAASLTQAQIISGDTLKDDVCSVTEEMEEGEMEEGEEEMGDRGRDLKEKRKCSLDLLIKLNQTGITMVKAEGLWAGRTTKCEADSSVLLCPKHAHAPNTHTPPASHPHSPLTDP
ncbi:proline-rich protein 35 [Denticeps clupeoides]|uniref:proline-rich protein 35 n=1 Tax=Denticeps clupeoides TaxID=299321 RepID=UPI0010A364E3|nr:proline-rich protein 35-like [Denticeps clupeoides]XP_028825773.1 proline-rich protein 35-like [Denticeps clupeoides]